jgi:hypothetical protein
MSGLFFRIYQHLLPRAEAWKITIAKTLRRFFEGLAVQPEATRLFADQVYEDLFPETTRALAEFEEQFGLEPNGDEAARRLLLAAEWQANGGQSPDYIQGVLQTAGFDVYIHDWWSSGPPYVARDPRAYTTRPLVGLFRCQALPTTIGKPRCTKFRASQARCNRFLNNDPHYLVNKDLTLRAPPLVPDDPNKWPYFMYVGGATFPNHATVDVTRRAEFERLLLKLRPAHLWIVTLIDYATIGGTHITTRSGLRITTRGGDRLITS